jgi:hypothetical protein
MLIGFIFQIVCFGAIRQNTQFKILNKVILDGAYNGGQAGDGFSLLNVKRSISESKKVERIIFEIGNYKGDKYLGQAGYFHAQLSKNSMELTIDFAQTVLTIFDNEKLIEVFKNSKIVKNTFLSVDAEDNSTNITLIFKNPIKVQVDEVASQESFPKIIFDLTNM